MEYLAALVPLDREEEELFGFPRLEVSAGRCVRTKLFDWAERTDQIEPCIGQMIAEFGIDPSRPTMEHYRSQPELYLVPMGWSAETSAPHL